MTNPLTRLLASPQARARVSTSDERLLASGERLLDVRQLAAYLGLDESRLWLMRLLHASLRGPQSIRVSGHSYWWRSDVDRWLEEHDLTDVLRHLGEDLIFAAAPAPRAQPC
jgi:predicted DNA-binding transcriptional regulator AlpA